MLAKIPYFLPHLFLISSSFFCAKQQKTFISSSFSDICLLVPPRGGGGRYQPNYLPLKRMILNGPIAKKHWLDMIIDVFFQKFLFCFLPCSGNYPKHFILCVSVLLIDRSKFTRYLGIQSIQSLRPPFFGRKKSLSPFF